MQAALWAAYAASLTDAPVDGADEKFAALAESERNAWAAVAAAAVPVNVAAPVPQPALPKV